MSDPWLDDGSRAGAARLGYLPPRPPWPARSRPLRRSPGLVSSASSSRSIALCSRGPNSEGVRRAAGCSHWTTAAGRVAGSSRGVSASVAYRAWDNTHRLFVARFRFSTTKRIATTFIYRRAPSCIDRPTR